jgi:hypothetical protein
MYILSVFKYDQQLSRSQEKGSGDQSAKAEASRGALVLTCQLFAKTTACTVTLSFCKLPRSQESLGTGGEQFSGAAVGSRPFVLDLHASTRQQFQL